MAMIIAIVEGWEWGLSLSTISFCLFVAMLMQIFMTIVITQIFHMAKSWSTYLDIIAWQTAVQQLTHLAHIQKCALRHHSLAEPDSHTKSGGVWFRETVLFPHRANSPFSTQPQTVDIYTKDHGSWGVTACREPITLKSDDVITCKMSQTWHGILKGLSID